MPLLVQTARLVEEGDEEPCSCPPHALGFSAVRLLAPFCNHRLDPPFRCAHDFICLCMRVSLLVRIPKQPAVRSVISLLSTLTPSETRRGYLRRCHPPPRKGEGRQWRGVYFWSTCSTPLLYQHDKSAPRLHRTLRSALFSLSCNLLSLPEHRSSVCESQRCNSFF